MHNNIPDEYLASSQPGMAYKLSERIINLHRMVHLLVYITKKIREDKQGRKNKENEIYKEKENEDKYEKGKKTTEEENRISRIIRGQRGRSRNGMKKKREGGISLHFTCYLVVAAAQR